jgi:hypothetical protein
MIIYNWAGEVKAEFKTVLAPAAIMVLVAITLLCNGVAGFLRNRYDKRRRFFCALTRGNRSFTRDPYRSISEGLDAAARRPLRPLLQRVL